MNGEPCRLCHESGRYTHNLPRPDGATLQRFSVQPVCELCVMKAVGE